MNLNREERGEGSNLGTIIVIILALPIVIGMLSTAGFVAWWKSRSAPAVTPAPVAAPAVAGSKPATPTPGLCPETGDNACSAFLQAVETARAGDAVKLRRYLSEGAWTEQLPKVAASPEERGQFLVRTLLGDRVESLEELRGPAPELVGVQTKTALDGESAQLNVRWKAGAAARASTLAMKKIDGQWTVTPPAR